MDASADVVRSPEGEGTPESVEPGSLLWACQQIEEVKAGLRDDPGRAYSVQFTAAAEMLREHDPVQFRSLRRLLKDKQVRLGEFDRLVEQRRRKRVEDRKRNRAVAAARISRTAHAIVRAPRTVGGGVQVGRYLANAQGLFLLRSIGRGVPPIQLPLANFTAHITAEIRRDDGVDARPWNSDTRPVALDCWRSADTRLVVQFASMARAGGYQVSDSARPGSRSPLSHRCRAAPVRHRQPPLLSPRPPPPASAPARQNQDPSTQSNCPSVAGLRD